MEMRTLAFTVAILTAILADGSASPEVKSLDAVAEPAPKAKQQLSQLEMQKLIHENEQHKALLKRWEKSEMMKEAALRKQRELGEGDTIKSCNAKCAAASNCNAVFIHSKTRECKQMLAGDVDAWGSLGEGAQLAAAYAAQNNGGECMKECQAKGEICKGVYIHKGDVDCHMVLEKSTGAADSPVGGAADKASVAAPAGDAPASASDDSPVTVNVNVRNGPPGSAGTGASAADGTESSVQQEVKALADAKIEEAKENAATKQAEQAGSSPEQGGQKEEAPEETKETDEEKTPEEAKEQDKDVEAKEKDKEVEAKEQDKEEESPEGQKQGKEDQKDKKKNKDKEDKKDKTDKKDKKDKKKNKDKEDTKDKKEKKKNKDTKDKKEKKKNKDKKDKKDKKN